jgi:aspartate kinase
MRVFKFGGASVKDAAAVRNVAHIVQQYGQGVGVVVVSAMGKTTNRLEDVVRALYEQGDAAGILREVHALHVAMAHELLGPAAHAVIQHLDNLVVEAEWLLDEGPVHPYDRTYDQIVPLGELMSTRIVSAYLNMVGVTNAWTDARDLIMTDSTYRDARILWELTAARTKAAIGAHVGAGGMVVTQGFMGVTDENYTTTLGREGSDFTAAILAHCLMADEVVIWKDVPGVLNADPKRFEGTVLIPQMSYLDAMELTWFGTSVIHPRTVKPLQNKGIPLRVRSFADPVLPGTLISAVGAQSPVPSFIIRQSQALVSITPSDYSFVVESHLEVIFSSLNRLRVRLNVMQNSAVSFSFATDAEASQLALLHDVLHPAFSVRWNDGLELITIRHYDAETIARLVGGREVLLEQRTRTSVQFVVRKN